MDYITNYYQNLREEDGRLFKDNKNLHLFFSNFPKKILVFLECSGTSVVRLEK